MSLSIRWRFSLALLIGTTCLLCGTAETRPYRGGIPWSFLLCKFSDSPNPPNDPTYYRNMTINSGTKGLQDYIKSISNGVADLTGSVLHGWYTEPHTTAYEQGLSNRYQRLQDCVDAAKASPTDPYTVPSGQRIYVITSPGVDLVGFENAAALGGDSVALPEIAHEFGHGVGLNHSWSNDITWKDASWAGPGEYDNPWDLMSAANVYVDPTGQFGGGPPDLDGHHLDELGWIAKSRILTLGVDGILSRTVTIAALTHPEASGSRLIRIPFDSNDRFHYYTVEYRAADSWDAGIPNSTLMINEVKNNNSYYQTTLIRELGQYAGTGNGPPVQSLNANGVIINLQNTSGNTATVQVSTKFALLCAQGFVWREASSIDRVCVVPATRTQAAADNAAAASRKQPGGGPYGPDTCKQGFVWREAFPNDHVCVIPATRAQVAADNANAYNHVNQSLVSYGPNTCQQGFVWRDGDDSDYVCVTGQTRSQTAADNAAAASRRQPGGGPYGPDTCKQGFVWRAAWPNDHVCVTPTTRTQAAADNAQATNRLQVLYADAMPPRSTRAALTLFGLIGQATASEINEPQSPAPVSESVLRTRLAKMGAGAVQKLERNGDFWEATVMNNGKTSVLRFHAQNGVKPQKVH